MAIGASLLPLVVACTSDRGVEPVTAPPSTVRPVPTYPDPPAGAEVLTGTALVLQWNGRPAVACFGSIGESAPPSCGGPALVHWRWEDVDPDAVEGDGQARWGRFELVGTFDPTQGPDPAAPSPWPFGGSTADTTFTLTAPPRTSKADRVSAAGGSAPEERCPTPAGGWPTPDRRHVGDADRGAFFGVARRSPDLAAVGIDREEGGVQVLYAAFTRDLEARRLELAQVWGGPFCVVEGRVTQVEFAAAQQRLLDAAPNGRVAGWPMLGTGPVPEDGLIEVAVVWAPPTLEAELEAGYGVPIRISRALRPLDR